MQRLKNIPAAAMAALLALGMVLVMPAPANAAVIRSFTPYFKSQTNGAITITGNALLTCPAGTNCTDAQTNPTATRGNNDFVMQFLDADNDATTKNSSGATVAIPTGSRVLYAGLFWGAATTAGTGGTAATGALDQIKLRTPGATAYQTVTATRPLDRMTSGGQDYSAYADITAIVRASGAGMYWAADIAAATGNDRYGGWSIIVAYSNPNLPLRDLTVFGGYASVQNSVSVTTSISGFLTPAAGPVNATFGSVVYEGDVQLTGDYFAVGTTRLADDVNRSANYFTSRISADGLNRTDRLPNYPNTMALDAKTVNAPNVLANGATSTNLTFGTSGDFYYPAALTSQIDLYAPTIVGNKSVINLNGNSPAQVGDVLEYTVTVSNTGLDPATNVVMTDPVPTGTTYLPDSLRITTGANTGVQSDASGDDQGEVTASGITVRLGTGATATTGGRLNTGDSTTVRFRVQVVEAGAGTTILNSAFLDYTGLTLGTRYTYETNETATPVGTLADVAIDKSGPTIVAAGAQATWTLTASNTGPNPAEDVVITDTLPDGVTFVPTAGTTCTADGATVTCPIGTVLAGQTVAVTVVGQVSPSAAGITLTNAAWISSSTADSNPGNNATAAVSDLTRSADLQLTKTVAPSNPAPGQSVTWTLTALNAGPSTATGVIITDTVPIGMTITAAPDTCTVTVRDVSCAVGDLAPDATASVQITTRLDPAWGSTASMSNAGAVLSTTPDPATGNNYATAAVTPTGPVADLGVVKTGPSSVEAGSPIGYQVRVTNYGPSRADNARFTDTLPAWLSNPSVNSDTGTCTLTGNAVDCALGDLPLGATATIVITADVAPGASLTLSNTASVTADSADPDLTNNTSTADTGVTSSADVSISKTAGPAVAGSAITYTLVAHNAGPSTAWAVEVRDAVPAVFTDVTASSGQGTCEVLGSQVSCSFARLDPSQDVTVTVTANIPADTDPAQLENTAQVSSYTPDPVPANNSATYMVPLATDADLVLTKTGPTTPVAGGPVAWTVQVTNLGPSDADNVIVTDAIPLGVENWTAAMGGTPCPAPDGVITCPATTLAAGSSATVTISGTLSASYTDPLLVNTATVTSDTNDPNVSSNTGTTSALVTTEADIAVAKTGPATVTAGSEITWTLTLSNDGPSTAFGVRMNDVLPANVTYVSSGNENGVTCTSVGPHAVSCTRDSLSPGESVNVTITGLVAPYSAPGTLSNLATIGSFTPEPLALQTDDQASADTTVTASADLSVAKSVLPSPMISGETATYTLSVHNAGPSTATQVVLTDTLPVGLTFVSVQSESACVTPAVGSGGTVVCTLATIAPGGTDVVILTVAVDSAQTGVVSNTATVTTATADPDAANDSVTVNTDAAPAADLMLTSTPDRAAIHAGEAVTYTLTVVNAGPSTATNTVVTTTLPAEMQVLLTDPACTLNGTTLESNLGALAVGGTAIVQFTGRIPAASTITELTTPAVVNSTTSDPNAVNNAADALVAVGTEANLSVTKSATPAVGVPGEDMSWLVVVNNVGPSAARNVVLTDEVPLPLTVSSASYLGTPCTVTGQSVSCAMGTVLPGQSVVEIATHVPADALDTQVSNTATVASSTSDPDLADNAGPATVPLAPQADLAITKTMTPIVAVAGQPATFTMIGVNNGPSVAQDVMISDTLPGILRDPVATATGPGGPVTCRISLLDAMPDKPWLMRCAYGDLAVGQTVTVSVTATVDSAAGGEIANTGFIGATTLDPASANNEDTVTALLIPAVSPPPSAPTPPAPPPPTSPLPVTGFQGGLVLAWLTLGLTASGVGLIRLRGRLNRGVPIQN